MSVLSRLSVVALLFAGVGQLPCVAGADALPDVRVRVASGEAAPLRRTVIGVNHLAYGSNGYGLLRPGSHAVEPSLVAMQREIGFGSLRYPGGCGGTHGFDWKRNAGLAGDYRVLGVLEFMEMCEQIGAEPILGVSSHRGTPEEAAAYVEFLTAPADDAHPWAKRRAARGRRAPFAVRYFEYGNETYHGTHPIGDESRRRIHPEAYADSYLKFRAAMQAADPNVRLGLVLTACGSGWNRRVLARAGGVADFFIRHTYCAVPVRTTEDGYLQIFLDRRRELARLLSEQRAEIGRPDAELAITEFNATYADHRTLSAALVNLESLMVFAADPQIVHADYWQFVNEGFGMVRGTAGAFVKRPNAWAFELFSRYTLDARLPVDVEDRRVAARPKAVADPEIAALRGRNFVEGRAFCYGGKKGRTTDARTATEYVRHDDGTHELRFLDDRAMNFYHLQMAVGGLPKGDRCDWKVSCKMRVEGMKRAVASADEDDEGNEDVNLDVTDGRGWSATHSSAALPAVGSPDWIDVSTVYHPLVDNPGSLIIRFRRDGAGARGRVFVRDLRLEAVAKAEPPRVSPIVGQLSVGTDRRAAALILINRSFTARDVAFDLRGIRGFAGRGALVSAEALTGPDAYTTNETDGESVRLVPLAASLRADVLRATLPPHSAAGFRIE